MDEISKEIQSIFDGDDPLRFKRLSKDSSRTPDTKRGLNFRGPGSSSEQEELQGKRRPCDSCCKPWSQAVPFGVNNPSRILAHGFVLPRLQNQLVEKAFAGAMPVVMFTTLTARR